VVPAGNVVVNIRDGPLIGVQVEDDDVVVLGLGVPATVGVELLVKSEKRVSTTTLRKGGLGDSGFVLGPSFCFDVERVDITESNAGVVKTTVTAINPELAVVVASTSVGSWWRCLNSRLLVAGDGLISKNTGPAVVRDLEPPAVVKSLGGAGVTAINEDTVKLGGGKGNVVGSCRGDLFTLGLLAFPTALLYK